MGLFKILFHRDIVELEKLDKDVQKARANLKEMLQAYHVKVLLVQELINAVRGSKEEEKQIGDIMNRLRQYVQKDASLSTEETSFVKAAEPLLDKMIEHEKDADLKKEKQGLREALGYFRQDLANADALVKQQAVMLSEQNTQALRHPEEARKVIELAKKEAEILFGIDGRSASEESLLKEISERIKHVLQKKH